MDTTEAQQWADLAPAKMMAFRVSIPPTQSAVMQHGLDGGYRIVITTDPTEEDVVHAFVKACRGRILRVVVLADDGGAP
jgi:hypothetical protein